MIRSRIFAAIVVVFAMGITGGSTARADGFIHIVPKPGQPAVTPLSLKFHKVQVVIDNQVARTAVDEEFYNPNNRQLEGIFMFPVPKGASIEKFSMFIDGKETEAELLDAKKARKIYEDIVRKMKDPALLEYVNRDLFKVRIFPIPARGTKRVKLTYHQLIDSDAGLYRYVYPLDTERFSSQPIKTVSIKVVLKSKVPIKNVYSPTHRVEINRKSDHEVVIGYEASQVKPDRDLEILYSLSEDRFGVNLLTHNPAGEDGYFMCLLSPRFDIKTGDVMPKDVCFVLDTSGSMAHDKKLDQARGALEFCLRNLGSGDRFNVIRFSTEVEALHSELVPADKKHLDEAIEFVGKFKPIGATAINEALLTALRMKHESARPYIIVFLTDGRATAGETTDADKIAANVKSANTAGTRIFCFGVGFDVNTHLLDKVAQTTRAVTQYVKPGEDIEVKVSSFFTKIKDPVLSQIALKFTNVKVKAVYPRELPDLFRGSQLMVVGRYEGHGAAAIELTGMIGQTRRSFTYEGEFTDNAGAYDFIPRLWATRKVGYLLDEIRLKGSDKELVDEVTRLAKRFGIVTPYTSYLIVEDQVRIASAGGAVANGRVFLREEARGMNVRRKADKYRKNMLDRSGKGAVAASEALQVFKSDFNRPAGKPASAGVWYFDAEGKKVDLAQDVRHVGSKTFYFNGLMWVDSDFAAEKKHKKVTIKYFSDAYFKLVETKPEIGKYLALGENIIVRFEGTIYQIKKQ